MSENGFGHFQASLSIPTTSAPSTSLCVPRSAAPSASASIPRSMPSRGARSFAPSPEPAAMQIDAPNGSNATLERVTVLESQVARLEANFLMLRVKLQEIESSVGPTPAPRSPVADSASTANNNTIRRPSTMMIHRIINQPSPIELPAGPALTDVDEGWDGEVTPKHTVAHTEGFRPDNCICAHSDQPDDADSDMADAN